MRFLNIVFLIATLVQTVPAFAAKPISCQALTMLKLNEVVHIEATSIPAGLFTPPGAQEPISGGELPAFCQVRLTVQPRIAIEVWLPEGRLERAVSRERHWWVRRPCRM